LGLGNAGTCSNRTGMARAGPGTWPAGSITETWKNRLEKLKETIRTKTKRTNGRCLPAIITDLNRTLKGWFGYFKHSRHWVFKDLDGWIRMRLRSILRKRQGKRGRGRGSDHQRWPNAYFAEMGLYSMLTAYRKASQPRGVH
jgi:RNA-directed DNA polymerase